MLEIALYHTSIAKLLNLKCKKTRFFFIKILIRDKLMKKKHQTNESMGRKGTYNEISNDSETRRFF